MKTVFYTSLVALILAIGISVAPAQTVFRERQSTGASGLTIPRFVSLSAGEANLRTGPGQRYPILWVYVRRGIPLEVTAEFGAWRRVRDMDGTIGWMHSALLSGQRTGVISGTIRTFFGEPNVSSTPVLQAEPGAIGIIEECSNGWCLLDFSGRGGWLPQEHFWGTYSNEAFQ
jgi:SH3-like domain-containing protein